MGVRAGLEESWMPKNWCFWTVVLEKTLESPLDFKEIQLVHSEGDQPWVFFGRNDAKGEVASTLATSYEELTHWKRLWCWEGLGAGGEGDDRGRDGWMASLTRWKWVWGNSGSWWWTGRPGVLRFMGSRRVRHYWAIELNWLTIELKIVTIVKFFNICEMKIYWLLFIFLKPEGEHITSASFIFFESMQCGCIFKFLLLLMLFKHTSYLAAVQIFIIIYSV